MKRLLCVIICALVLLAPLCACGKEKEETADPGVSSLPEEKWIDQKFSEAELMYAWFSGCARPACDNSNTVDTGEALYVRVTEAGLDSTDALRRRLGDYFAEEVVSSLMSTVIYSGAPIFRDIDGALYCCREVNGKVPHDIGERIGTIDSQTDTEMVYRVDVVYDYYASSFAASYDYYLVKGEDDVWRFIDFQLPALLIADQMFMSDQE